MQRTRMVRLTAAVAAAGALMAGCTGNDRAGGAAGDTVVTLTLGNPNNGPPAQISAFVDAVTKLSHGRLKIEYKNAVYHGDPDYETRLVNDVKSSSLDLAWVGPRVFDTMEVASFQPLLAPLLVDSQDLQGKVFAAGIPDQMLAGSARPVSSGSVYSRGRSGVR
jgi:ABC-type glycerol-3-phosphate transport system substrate-binding protein